MYINDMMCCKVLHNSTSLEKKTKLNQNCCVDIYINYCLSSDSSEWGDLLSGFPY